MCESTLSSSLPDTAIIASLATRELFAHAVTYCNELSGANDELIAILFSHGATDEVMSLRVSAAFEPLRFRNLARPPRVTRNTLRKKLGDPAKHETAAATLAALGEIDWPFAPRRARAAYVLRLLVLSLRERPS
jgi:hypothetical protein